MVWYSMQPLVQLISLFVLLGKLVFLMVFYAHTSSSTPLLYNDLGSFYNATASVVNTYAVQVTLAPNATLTHPPTKTVNAVLTVAAVRYLYPLFTIHPPLHSKGFFLSTYRYSDWPVATLYSTTGLPASPFYFIFVNNE